MHPQIKQNKESMSVLATMSVIVYGVCILFDFIYL